MLEGGEKASIFCYLQAARTRDRQKKDVAPGLLPELNKALLDETARLEIGPARQRIKGASEAKDLAWALRRDGRTAGEVYRRQAYGHPGERLGIVK